MGLEGNRGYYKYEQFLMIMDGVFLCNKLRYQAHFLDSVHFVVNSIVGFSYWMIQQSFNLMLYYELVKY